MSCSASLRQHRAIGGRRREARSVALYLAIARQQLVRRRGCKLDRRGADAEREQHVPAEAEREGERRRADEAVVAVRLQHVLRRRCRTLASMSRWKCMVPFGSPVVPDVKAIRQTSSLAVSQAVKFS